jgi:cysteine desulfurase
MSAEYYFDHAASAPRLDAVVEAMAPWMHGVVGNPSGAHRAARAAREAIEVARDEVASFVGVEPTGVIFTAGGTESCHLAIEGVMGHAAREREHAVLLISAIEHHAVGDAAAKVARLFPNVTVHTVPVTDSGVVDLQAHRDLIDRHREDIAMVSVMTANNETGVIQPLDEVSATAKSWIAGGAVTHTDAVAAAPWLYLPGVTSSMDLVSICAHKLGGPVSSGALIVRGDVRLDAVIPGGGQERGLRGGTVDVAAAVGLAAAVRETARRLEETNDRVAAFQEQLISALTRLPGARISGHGAPRLAGTVHVTFEGVASDELLFLLDRDGVYASAAASCSSGAAEPSHVLAAMGITPARARGSLRLSMGAETTESDVEYVITALTRALEHLRASS